MVTRNIKEGWVDYDCKIVVGSIDGEKKVWVEMVTPEFGRIGSKRLKAVDDMSINHQLGESLVDELIDSYEFNLKARANS